MCCLFFKICTGSIFSKHVVQRDELSSPPWGCRRSFHGPERLRYLLSTCSPFLLEVGNHGCMGWRHWSADLTGSSTHLSHTSSVPWPSSVPKGHCCLALTDLCHGRTEAGRWEFTRNQPFHVGCSDSDWAHFQMTLFSWNRSGKIVVLDGSPSYVTGWKWWITKVCFSRITVVVHETPRCHEYVDREKVNLFSCLSSKQGWVSNFLLKGCVTEFGWSANIWSSSNSNWWINTGTMFLSRT